MFSDLLRQFGRPNDACAVKLRLPQIAKTCVRIHGLHLCTRIRGNAWKVHVQLALVHSRSQLHSCDSRHDSAQATNPETYIIHVSYDFVLIDRMQRDATPVRLWAKVSRRISWNSTEHGDQKFDIKMATWKLWMRNRKISCRINNINNIDALLCYRHTVLTICCLSIWVSWNKRLSDGTERIKSFHTREVLLYVTARICKVLTCASYTRGPSHARQSEKIYCSLMRRLKHNTYKIISDETIDELYVFA